jgi:hypothetical protein
MINFVTDLYQNSLVLVHPISTSYLFYCQFIFLEFCQNTSEKVKLTDLVLYHYQTQDDIVVQSCMDMGMESLALMAQYNKMTNLKR